MGGNYPEGDTFNECYTDSGIPFKNPDMGAPDSRGFSAPDAVLQTSLVRVDGDSVQARHSDNTGQGGKVSGTTG